MNIGRRGLFRGMAGAAAAGVAQKVMPSAVRQRYLPPSTIYGGGYGDEACNETGPSRVLSAAQQLAKRSAREAARLARGKSRTLGRLLSMSDAARDYYLAVAEDKADTLDRQFSRLMGWAEVVEDDDE